MGNRTIKNSSSITIKRKLASGEVKNETVGSVYFECSRDIKDCSMQIYLDEKITDEEELSQIGKIYKELFLEFIEDAKLFGWDMLDIRK